MKSKRENKNDSKSISNDDIARLIEKISLKYRETLKKLAEIERKEKKDRMGEQ